MRSIHLGLLVTLFAACADEARGPLLEPAIVDGKADASERVAMKGALAFGDAVQGTFSEDLEWHGYTIAVRPDARVTLEVTQKGSSRSVDTTMYLYGPKSAVGYGTTATAFDDDSGWGRLSRLGKQTLAGGEWLVVIGTHDGRGRGNYRVQASCDSGECTPVAVASACHPAIIGGIDACVRDWFDNNDPGLNTHADVIAMCADAEPMSPVRDALCEDSDDAVCALDMETFQTSYLAACRVEAVSKHLDTACVFGDRYRDLFGGAEAIVVLGQRRLTDPSAVTALEGKQIIAAVGATAHEPATVAEAFDVVDDNEVNQVQVWDASNRKAYTVYEVGAGDNSFGMAFDFGTTTSVARNNDGDWYDCTITWGPERRRCDAEAQCAEGTQCVGSSEASALGRCIATDGDDHAATGTDCTVTAGVSSCPGDAGLVCAGAALDGSGMCLPAWMKGTFLSEPMQSIPDNNAAGGVASLLVYGLATVDMDVVVDVYVAHARPRDIKVTLTNPAGNEVVVFDGASSDASEISLRAKALSGFSGDESVNGVWTLKAVDSKSGQAGSIERFGLTITSRWD